MTRRIDSYSIRLFVAAARAGSILRAGEQEHIAPSALSRRLADLEHAFGTPLLVRSPRGVTLTDAGQLVFERAQYWSTAIRWLGGCEWLPDGREYTRSNGVRAERYLDYRIYACCKIPTRRLS